MVTRETGTCVAWSRTTGWIQPDVGGRQVMCHYTAIESDDRYRALSAGQRVTFERGTDPWGRETAIDVQQEAGHDVSRGAA